MNWKSSVVLGSSHHLGHIAIDSLHIDYLSTTKVFSDNACCVCLYEIAVEWASEKSNWLLSINRAIVWVDICDVRLRIVVEPIGEFIEVNTIYGGFQEDRAKEPRTLACWR